MGVPFPPSDYVRPRSASLVGRDDTPRCRKKTRLTLERLEDRLVLSGVSATLQLFPPSGQSGSSAPVTIALDSYAFGFQGQDGSVRTSFDELEVNAPLSGNSPLFLKALTTGSAYATAVLAQRDAAGNTVAAWVLGDVAVTSDVVSNDSSGVPGENLRFVYGAITEATSAGTASWSQSSNRSDSSDIPALPAGTQLAPLPIPAPSALMLQINPGGLAPLTLTLNSYQLGFRTKFDHAPEHTDDDARINFNDLMVTAPVGAASLQMFAHLVRSADLGKATLIQNNAAGQAVAEWAFSNLRVATDEIRADAGSLPEETLHLHFGAITAATSSQSASYSLASRGSAGSDIPTLPPGTTLTPLPARSGTGLTLELQPGPGSSTPAPITITLDSYQFGASNSFGVHGSERAVPDDLVVTLTYGPDSPGLLQRLTERSVYQRALLTQRSSAGQPIAAWALGTVSIGEDDVTANAPSSPVESLHIFFNSITEATSSQTASWSFSKNGKQPGDVPAAPSVLTPLPGLAATGMTLRLQPDGTNLAPTTIALNSYEFGFHGQPAVGGPQKATFDDLIVTTSYGVDSPVLFDDMVSGTSFVTVVLTQTDSAGQPVAEWVLGEAFIVRDEVSALAQNLPSESLRLFFAAITVSTGSTSGTNGVASWNVFTSSDVSQPTAFLGAIPPPTGISLAALPTPQPLDDLTLEFLPSTGPPSAALTFGLDAFQFGFQHPVIAGTGTTKATFDTLVVSTILGDRSSLLFQALVKGSIYDTVVLTQRDPASHEPVAMWVLGSVIITQLNIGNDTSATPRQNLTLAFDAITEATSSQSASWSQVTNSRSGKGIPALPAGTALAALPTPTASALTLELLASNDPGAASPLDLVLDSYQFGFQNPAVIDSTGPLFNGSATFAELSVSAPYAANSPLLFRALTAGTRYGMAVLTQRNSAGQPVAVWVLGNVLISSDGMGGGVVTGRSNFPTETLHLAFTAITEATRTQSASWNALTNSVTGAPALPPGVMLSAISPATVTVRGDASTFDGTAHLSSATATGVDGAPVAGSFALAYSQNGVPATPMAAGVYQVIATFTSADADYADSAGTGTIVINPAAPTVTVSSDTFMFDGTAKQATATAATVGIGVVTVPGSFAFAYRRNGNPAAPVGAGTYQVTATFTSADPNYADAIGTGQVVIEKASAPVITFGGVTDKTYGDADFTLSATASFGPSLTFTATGNVTIVGNRVHITGAGRATIIVDQVVDSNIVHPSPVSQAFLIGKAATSMTVLASPNPSGRGEAVTFRATVSTIAASSGGSVTFWDGTVLLGSAELDSSGHASIRASGVSRTIGDHAITAHYSGSDNDLASVSAVFTQHVTSPQQQAAALVGQVNALVTGGMLKRNSGHTLTAALKDAIKALDKGNSRKGLNKLNDFVKKVNTLKKSAKLTAAQGQALIDAANHALASAAS